MNQPVFAPTTGVTSPKGGRLLLVWGGGGFGVAILFGALALWFHYGTAVFFEMIASGISACL
jgi:hypothetical protein